MFNKNSIVIIIILAVSLIFGSTPPITLFAATSPSLGATSTYGITSSTYTNSLNTGTETTINGDICYTTPPATAPIAINGVTVTPCAPARGTDQSTALADLNSQACTSLGVGAVTLNTVIMGANPAGTFPPGCYESGGAMLITSPTTVTLSGAGTYIFRPGGAITTGANSLVTLANGASACDVFWAPVGATTIGANSSTSATPTFVGNILQNSLNAFDVSLGHFVNLSGRVLAFGRVVTTDSNTITVPTCVAPQLTVTKTVTNDNSGTKIVSNFSLFLDGGSVNSGAANTTSAGSHTVSETSDSGYTTTIGGDCAADGTITLASGNVKTCTINNNDIAAHLIVVKHVVNDNGGVTIASGFSTTITGVTTATPTATGAEAPGVNNTLTSLGAYSVDEGAHVGYDKTLSADCSGTIALGETKTCTITNDDQAPSLTLDKIIINNNSGASAESAWTLTATGPTSISGPGATLSTDVVSDATFDAGTYTLSESAGPSGYTASSWSCVKNGGAPVTGISITLDLGNTATCTITNDDIVSTSSSGSSRRSRVLPPLIDAAKVFSSSDPFILSDDSGFTNATAALSVPGLPDTGFPPEEKSTPFAFSLEFIFNFILESQTGNGLATFYEQEKINSPLPVRLKIPKINVDATVDYVGLAPDGTMDVPTNPENTAWFNLGPRPGENGSSVIDGHAGWKNGMPAVFDNLYKLHKGDKIYVEDSKGTTTTFVVREIRKYDPNENASDVFGSSDGASHLNLITCAGVWNELEKTHSDRLVVFSDKE